jgi:hypothetical protein
LPVFWRNLKDHTVSKGIGHQNGKNQGRKGDDKGPEESHPDERVAENESVVLEVPDGNRLIIFGHPETDDQKECQRDEVKKDLKTCNGQ